MSALASAYPELRIVGEEDEDEEGVAPVEDTLRRDLIDAGADDDLVPLSELTVFVDPVDGTREFVEGRLGAVQTLVGLSRRGRAVGGAVGLPFPHGGRAAPCVVWGVVGGAGVGGVGEAASGTLGEFAPGGRVDAGSASGLVSVTGDSSNALLAAARELVAADTNAIFGGAGNKLLQLAHGRADVALMHFGTSLWDTCAPEAVLAARGGRVTDLFGAPLVHDADSPAGLINRLGVLATAPAVAHMHDELCARMRADARLLALLEDMGSATEGPAGAQAVDVSRCLSGAPLSRAWIEGAMCPPAAGEAEPAHRLASYSAPEADAVRGLMSEACRLELEWAVNPDAKPGAASVPPPPASAFYKRIAMSELEHARLKARTAPLKLARDTRSYAVEATFLGSAACEALVNAGVPVARAYAVDLRPCAADPLESRFGLLLEEFRREDGWSQHWLCNAAQARAALAGLAKLHAFFWEGSKFWAEAEGGGEGAAACEELTAAVWPSGAYWQPSMQPAEQLTELVAKHWPEHARNFAEAFAQSPMLEGVDVGTLGARLQAVAPQVGAESHPFGSTGKGAPGMKTLIHGDPKVARAAWRARARHPAPLWRCPLPCADICSSPHQAANIFLRETATGEVQVGLIDLQWCGFGLAATDVAHHIVAGTATDCLSVDGSTESALLDHYHAELMAALVSLGGFSPERAAKLLPRDVLEEQYENAVLDMARVVFAYQWARVKASPATLAKNAPSMGRNSYNKSVEHACWLVGTTDRVLKRREARGAGQAA